MALFNIFWKLADDEQARNEGVAELLELLRADADKNVQENREYSLKRLVRGLGSSRGAARQGFAAALTEVLLQFPAIPTASVIALDKQLLSVGNDANKQEKKDFYLSRIFFALVLARSDRLGQLTAVEGAAMVDQLIQLGQDKPLLREACFETLGTVCVAAEKEKGETRDVILSKVASLFNANPSWDCDFLNLALLISSSMAKPAGPLASVVTQARSKPAKFKTALVESMRVYPAVHCVWTKILDVLCADPSFVNLTQFWLAVVEGGLFNDPRPKCKYLGFRLFERILNRLTGQEEAPPSIPKKKKKRKKPTNEDSEQEGDEEEEEEQKEEEVKVQATPAALKAISALFSKNFIRTLVNNLGSKATQLREAALHTRNTLVRGARGRPGVALVMANHLGESTEGVNFDIRTRSKTVTLLLGQLNENGVAEYLRSLFASFSHVAQLTPLEDETPELFEERQKKQNEINRAGQIEQMAAVSKNCHISRQPTQGWMSDILEFFLRNGFFEDSTVVISPKTKELCRAKFFSLMTDLLPGRLSMSRTHGAGEEAKTVKIEEDVWGLKAHELWTKIATQHQLVTPLSPNDLSVRESTLKLVKAITKKVESLSAKGNKATDKAKQHEKLVKIGQLHALQLLMLQLSLLQLNGGGLESTQLLQELEECYHKFFEKQGTMTDEDEPTPVEVLVDILLSLLATESGHIREVANQVMHAFSGDLTPKALQSIVGVLVSKDQGDEEDEEEEEEGEEHALEEENGEAKPAKPAKKRPAVAARDEEEEEEDEEESEEEEVDLATLQELLAADPEPGFAKNDEDSEEAEMDTYDNALADMMRLRQAKKNAGKDLKRQSLHFKLRVLDLLSLFVKRHGASPLILDILKPLLDCFHATRSGNDNAVLHERLLALFRKLCKPEKYPTIGEELGSVPAETFKGLFTEFLQRAQKTAHRDDLSLVSSALLFLVRIGVPLGDAQGATEEGAWVVAQYSAALSSHLTAKKSALNTKFFTDFISRFPVLGFALSEPLIQLSNTGAKEFQRLEALQLLRVLFQSKGDLKSQSISSLGPSVGQLIVVLSATEGNEKQAKLALQTANDYVTLTKKAQGKVNLGKGVSEALAVMAGSNKLKKFVNNLVRNAKLDFDVSLLKKQ